LQALSSFGEVAVESNSKKLVAKLIEELTRQRDELRLQIHLGSVEAKEQLRKLEDQLRQLSERFAPTKEAVGESAENVWEALVILGGEIKTGFERIWKSLKPDQ
jgi:hypothetical protein